MTAFWSGLRVRTRLALWYMLLLAGSILALGALGLWAVERTLYAQADELLRSRAAAVQTEIDFERGRLVVELSTAPGAGIGDVTAGLDLVRVWDANGRLLYEKESQPGQPPADPGMLEAVLGGQATHQYVTTPGALGPTRLYAEPVRDRERTVGAVQVGRSEVEIQSILGELRLLGSGGLLLAVVVAGFGGSFLARRALAPVDRITRAAQRIGADDLSQRLALPLPDDELGRLASAFDEMIDRLERAFQRQRQFTADASHELRTPLAVIRSQADVALSQPRDSGYYARVLSSVREESERLGRLAESLLVLARADAGQPLAVAHLDLEDLVAEVGASVAPRARQQRVELEVAIESAARVRGDGPWLTQLLLNLLDNALRHTPAGGRVRLALRAVPDGVRLEVADTGEGIGPEHLSHVFERFYRADPSRSRAAGGAGLGLAICDWISRAHGGRLEVDSTVGAGTSFSLWLPAAAPDESRDGPAARPAEARPLPAT